MRYAVSLHAWADEVTRDTARYGESPVVMPRAILAIDHKKCKDFVK